MLYVANYGYLSFSVIWTLPIFKCICLLTLYKICILYLQQDPQEALPILLMVWPLFEVNPGDEITTIGCAFNTCPFLRKMLSMKVIKPGTPLNLIQMNKNPDNRTHTLVIILLTYLLSHINIIIKSNKHQINKFKLYWCKVLLFNKSLIQEKYTL